MIPTFVQQLFGSVVRHAVSALAGALATYGIVLSEEQSVQITATITSVVIPIAWSFWQKYRSQQVKLTALAVPRVMSEQEAENLVSDPKVPTPSVLTPTAKVPN